MVSDHKHNPTPPDAVLIAIDMSKHRQEVLIERPECGRRRRMTVMATKSDYERLASDLADIGRPVVVGFEATGKRITRRAPSIISVRKIEETGLPCHHHLRHSSAK